MVLYFISNQESPFYNSQTFIRILDFVQKNPRRCQMREKNGKLTLSFEQVGNIDKALKIISSF
jgi:transcription-repair coupling factor (superfamily II helicase)